MTHITLEVVNFGTPGPGISGLNVSYCSGDDPTCSAPLAGPVTTDAKGLVSLDVPIGPSIQGQVTSDYVEATSSSSSSEPIVPELGFVGFPFSEPSYESVNLASRPAICTAPALVVTPDALASIYTTFLEAPQRPKTGTIAAIVGDCLAAYAAGVKVVTNIPAEAGSSTVYFLGKGMTGAGGFVLILNVPPGTVEVTAIPVSLDKPSGVQSVVVRDGWVTAMALLPTPSP
jgi:hypothetical protein